jgi:hypothetical protein
MSDELPTIHLPENDAGYEFSELWLKTPAKNLLKFSFFF